MSCAFMAAEQRKSFLSSISKRKDSLKWVKNALKILDLIGPQSLQMLHCCSRGPEIAERTQSISSKMEYAENIPEWKLLSFPQFNVLNFHSSIPKSQELERLWVG